MYPKSLALEVDPKALGFDCLQPVLTLSMFPEELDLNQDGYWTVDEADSLASRIEAAGSEMVGDLAQVLRRMARYDQTRLGSKSLANRTKSRVDMEFFRKHRDRLKMCLPVDPALCGNLEASGKLKEILPHVDDAEDRYVECKQNFEGFCKKVFGADYRWIYMKTTQICGEPEYDRSGNVNVVSYEKPETYSGLSDSIVGRLDASFKRFSEGFEAPRARNRCWTELRTQFCDLSDPHALRVVHADAHGVPRHLQLAIRLLLASRNVDSRAFQVIIRMPSTSNEDPDFASVEDDKMVVKQLPWLHKAFAILCIGLPRLTPFGSTIKIRERRFMNLRWDHHFTSTFMRLYVITKHLSALRHLRIACTLTFVGTSFLAATTNLQDLVLNSTALHFLLEVDNMIHASLLGDGFERHVLDQCAPVTVQSEVRGTSEPYGAFMIALCPGLLATFEAPGGGN